MKSFLGSIIQNKAPTYSSKSGGSSLFPSFGSTNQETLLRQYGSIGTLFAIVNRLSNSTALNEWHLYRKPTGQNQDRTEVFSHPALTLWNMPNPQMTREEFVETIQQHIDLVGESIWYLSYSTLGFGPPLEMWPVRPDKVSPVTSQAEFISGWEFKTPDGNKQPWKKQEVIQVKMPNPMDPFRGLGPVQTVLMDIDSVKYSAQWNAQFFVNGAEPGGIIEVDKSLTDEEFNEMTDRWREQHKGVANAHKVAIVEHGKWIDRKITQRDMQFEELSKLGREFIREAYGFPKPLLGSVDDVNRANAEAGELVFSRWLIRPRLERIKQALNSKLLPLYGASGQGLEFDYEDPVSDDLAGSTEVVTKLVASGFDPEDVLAMVGMRPMRYIGSGATANGN